MTTKAVLPMLFALFLPLCLAAPAAAQAEKGDNEVLVFGNVSMNPKSAGDSANGNFFFNVGRFVSNHTQIGVGPSISISKGTGGSSVNTTFGLTTFLRQYFGSARVAPYLGGELFMQDVQDSDTNFVNIIGGVKNYFSDRAAIDFKGAYGFGLTTPSILGFEGERQQMLQFSVGLTVLF